MKIQREQNVREEQTYTLKRRQRNHKESKRSMNNYACETMSENQLSCSECKGRLAFDQVHGEVVCEGCGLVNEESFLQGDFDCGEFNGRGFGQGAPLGHDYLLMPGKMGSSMMKTSRDGKGRALSEEKKRYLWRLNKLDRRSTFKTSTERNLSLSLRDLREMGKALCLPDYVCSTAALFYRFAVNQRLTVGRNADDFLCASLYCACLKTGYPMTLAELTTSLEGNGWGNGSNKRTGKAVKILKRSLHLKLGPPTPQMLISRFCSRLHLKPETERKTRDILSEIQEKELLDGRPGGIAAAAIYVASHLCGEKVSQKHLAKVAGVTDMTVRHQYKRITKGLNIRVAPQ